MEIVRIILGYVVYVIVFTLIYSIDFDYTNEFKNKDYEFKFLVSIVFSLIVLIHMFWKNKTTSLMATIAFVLTFLIVGFDLITNIKKVSIIKPNFDEIYKILVIIGLFHTMVQILILDGKERKG
jgi:hypothetical protein